MNEDANQIIKDFLETDWNSQARLVFVFLIIK
jgi:hypothetical protein